MSSAFTCFMSGIATLRGTVRVNGFAPSWSLIEYSPSSLLRPRNRLGNCSIRLGFSSWTAPMCTASSSAWITGWPSRGFHNFSTTNTSCYTSLFPWQNLPVNCPFTGSTWLQGPRRVLCGGLREGLPISLWIL